MAEVRITEELMRNNRKRPFARVGSFIAALVLALSALIGGLVNPAPAGATPYYPDQFYTFVHSELLPTNMAFMPEGGCGCGSLSLLNMPQGTMELSPQGKQVALQHGGPWKISFGAWTEFRVSSPDAALTIEVDSRPFAATNYLTKGGKSLTLHIKAGDNVSRLQVQIISSFTFINPFTDEAPGVNYDPETRHNIDPLFLPQWQARGGLMQSGHPVTRVGYELINGNIYLVQYFERARFEYHPENTDAQFQVLLGAFGRVINNGADPARPAPTTAEKDDQIRYFPETGHYASGRFLAYWKANGGLAQFGYPIGEEKYQVLEDGVPHTVQYFERARMEFHSENREPYMVMLGQFGRQIASKVASDRYEASK